jgi:cardiolipin synthase
MQQILTWAAFASAVFYVVLTAGLCLRVLSKRRSTGVSLAWIVLLLSFPLAGAVIYVFVGETWLSGRRSRRTAEGAQQLKRPLDQMKQRFGVSAEIHHHAASAIADLGRSAGLSPPLDGNSVLLFSDADAVFDRIIEDINSAEYECDCLYYIWESQGRIADVESALIAASARGVLCRLLVDAVGAKRFLRSKNAHSLKSHGVQVRAALPVNLMRGRLHRIDLRNHRKVTVIDNRVAYVGSMNMADPKTYQKDEGFGAWVDLTLRVQGPSATLLSELFEIDWAIESSDAFQTQIDSKSIPVCGKDIVQVVPSGPGQQPATIFRIMTAAVYGAQESLLLTTPYFVPDEAFVAGLVSAALRGVETTVVVPAKVDGVLTRLASRAYYDELLEAGVNVCLYEGGMLHAKTLTVDGEVGIIGTVNLDRRSFWLNYELSLVLHGNKIVTELAAAQRAYIDNSSRLSNSKWVHRKWTTRYIENCVQLLSPIL